jgi:hypothetical protein
VVSLFTTANLTYTSDKLPAISAIARKMAEYSKDDYLAGMWRNDLLLQLPWSLVGKRQFSRLAGYRAPTWSWASTDGEAELVLPTYPTMLAELHDAYVTSPINDPFLEVDSGSITVACYLMKGTIELFENAKKTGNKMPRSCLVFAGHYANLTYYFSDYSREGLELPHENIYCLPIYQYYPSTENPTNSQLVRVGLQKIGKGVYERCGMWWAITPSACEYALALAKATELDQGEYLDKFGEGRYKIEIV